MSTDAVSRALSTDPLSEAEKFTGESYKDDPETMQLGMLLAMLHNERKKDLLQQSRDSFFSMDFVQQLALYADLGFSEVFREEFHGSYGPETFVILWHTDGILATCETHMVTHRNSTKVYYNYRHQSGGYPHRLASSGHLNGDVWVGDHDAREGVRHNLDAMRAEGEFLTDWVERPFLWLLNYAEPRTDGYDHDAINARKIAKLPAHVRRSISPEANR